MFDNAKVFSAATFGFAAPVINLFVNTTTPVLNALVLVGQIAVAAVTTLYIYRKAQALRRDNKRKKRK